MPEETLVVLGPSGSGKSVLLRILNLLEPPTAGTISFNGEEVHLLKRSRRLEVSRRMAMVFQDPLLFRGKVRDNVAYGLKVRGASTAEREARVDKMLEMVGLDGLSGNHVWTLSGGEAQRVAVARALVIEPELLLLDEPFANLDPPARRELQDETRNILHHSGRTAVFVTHDREEAARMGDRIMVLDGGRIAQEGSARDIFYQPESEFVARFVGVDNIYRGVVIGSSDGVARVSVEGGVLEAMSDRDSGARVTLGIRPEDVTLVPASEIGIPASSRNAFVGRVTGIELSGPVARVTIDCPFPLVALVTRRSLEELGIEVGAESGARFKAVAVAVIEGTTGAMRDINEENEAS